MFRKSDAEKANSPLYSHNVATASWDCAPLFPKRGLENGENSRILAVGFLDALAGGDGAFDRCTHDFDG